MDFGNRVWRFESQVSSTNEQTFKVDTFTTQRAIWTLVTFHILQIWQPCMSKNIYRGVSLYILSAAHCINEQSVLQAWCHPNRLFARKRISLSRSDWTLCPKECRRFWSSTKKWTALWASMPRTRSTRWSSKDTRMSWWASSGATVATMVMTWASQILLSIRT